ncbi:hypothetical protein OV320_7822 [Actinobacteria bacterium OV320]|nr:hypothetical protein OV320_7822 [Actinobacteria bacterium OV320]
MHETVLETYFDKDKCEEDRFRFADMVKKWADPMRWGVRVDDISDDRVSAWRLVLVDRGEEEGK